MGKTMFLVGLFLLSFSLSAHRVNVFAYKEGELIRVEGYFSDGTPARDSKIEVYNQGGEKIAEGRTDEKGEFSFPVPEGKNNLRIILMAGMGHRGETSLSVEGDLSPDRSQESLPVNEDIEKIVEKSVEKALKPLIRMMEEENRRMRLRDIIGGIGYILGITGIAFYLLSRRRND